MVSLSVAPTIGNQQILLASQLHNVLATAELLPKAKAARPDVPVIMITTYGDAETKRKALEGGAEALFTKRFNQARARPWAGVAVTD
ncbi:MAG: response regulator [Pseudolabrys sp.]